MYDSPGIAIGVSALWPVIRTALIPHSSAHIGTDLQHTTEVDANSCLRPMDLKLLLMISSQNGISEAMMTAREQKWDWLPV